MRTVRRSRCCGLVAATFIALGLCLATRPEARAQVDVDRWFGDQLHCHRAPETIGAEGGHAFGGNGDLPAAFCENQPLRGTLYAVNVDLFGDSHLILRAWAVIDHPDGPIELPLPGGTMSVIGPYGNAICYEPSPGEWDYPCISGAPGTTFSNEIEWPPGSGEFTTLTLPGEIGVGAIVFKITGYTFREDDPDWLQITLRLRSEDLCETGDPVCAGGGFQGSWSQELALNVRHPRIAIVKTADRDRVCEGVPTPVTYDYEVTATGGNVGLAVVVYDDGCAPVVFTGGDDNGNEEVDPGETWSFECATVIDAGGTSSVSVTGFSDVDGCIAIDEHTLTIPATRADLSGDGKIGFADILILLANWGPCSGCPEDLDDDGFVGFAEVLEVLALWGPCV